jgi:UDP-glucose 4-epimerase
MIVTNEPAAVAVVGARGFIGSRLADTLEIAGIPVARITRSDPMVAGGALAAPLRSVRTIFYAASSINPAAAERYPERVAADRAVFRELLAAVRAAGTRPAIVLTSSAGAVYDPAVDPPYRETDPTRPSTAYGRAKLDLERDLLAMSDAVRPIVLRIANAYGPGQRTGTMQGVIGHWLEAAVAGEPLRLYGDPSVSRDYVFVDDVVEAMVHAYRFALETRDQGPEVFNIASGRAVSLAELLELVRGAVGRDLPAEHLPGRGFDRRDVSFDVRHGAAVLGWLPRTPLDQGLLWTWRRLVDSWQLAEAVPVPVLH